MYERLEGSQILRGGPVAVAVDCCEWRQTGSQMARGCRCQLSKQTSAATCTSCQVTQGLSKAVSLLYGEADVSTCGSIDDGEGKIRRRGGTVTFHSLRHSSVPEHTYIYLTSPGNLVMISRTTSIHNYLLLLNSLSRSSKHQPHYKLASFCARRFSSTPNHFSLYVLSLSLLFLRPFFIRILVVP